MHRLTTAALLLALSAGALPGQQMMGKNDKVFELTQRIARGSWVRISSPNGQIAVTQGSGDQVELRAEKILRGGSVEDVEFAVYKDNDGLTVCAVYEGGDCDRDGSSHNEGRRGRGWNWRQQAKVNFTVRIPAGSKVRAASGNGDVSLTGVGDEAIAASGNGKILVSGTTGEVEASTGNGEVTVEEAKGPVHASSGNGDVRVRTSLGPVSASSGNGDIIVAMDKLTDRHSMEFSTGNGRIEITVPDDFGAELESNTGNGSIVSDFPITIRGRMSKSHVRGTLGGGGPRLTLTSGNGEIEIRKRS